MLFALLLAAQTAALMPALPISALVFNRETSEPDFVKLCGPVNSQCRETQYANMDLLKKRYDAPTATVEQKVKLLSMIDERRKVGFVDWQQVRNEYEAWLITTGAAVRPVYPSAPTYRSRVRCKSEYSGKTYTSECVSD